MPLNSLMSFLGANPNTPNPSARCQTAVLVAAKNGHAQSLRRMLLAGVRLFEVKYQWSH